MLIEFMYAICAYQIYILYVLQVCVICGDPFEQFYDDEEEEWHLRDAMRVDDKTYHPVCYEDAKNVNSFCFHP